MVNLFTYLILVGVLVGSIASLPRIGLRTIPYIFIALVGAFIGALSVFGDAPILIKYSYVINEKTASVAISIIFVLISLFIERKFILSKKLNKF